VLSIVDTTNTSPGITTRDCAFNGCEKRFQPIWKSGCRYCPVHVKRCLVSTCDCPVYSDVIARCGLHKYPCKASECSHFTILKNRYCDDCECGNLDFELNIKQNCYNKRVLDRKYCNKCNVTYMMFIFFRNMGIPPDMRRMIMRLSGLSWDTGKT